MVCYGAGVDVPAPGPPSVPEEARHSIEIGQRIRHARKRLGQSMRAVAEAVGISQSALSQIETGKSQPSVQTLYRLVRELGLSFDDLVGRNGDGGTAAGGPVTEACPGGLVADASVEFVPAGEQQRIELDTGVTWHRLARPAGAGANVFRIVHPPGSDSAPDGKYASHPGREFVYVLTGRLRLEVGFDVEHLLQAGDAVSFPATTPHRASNPGPESTEIICALIEGKI